MKDWLYCNSDSIGWILATIASFSLFSAIVWGIILYGLYSIFLPTSVRVVILVVCLIGALLFIAANINEIVENGKKK